MAVEITADKAATVNSIVSEIQAGADTILTTLATFDPALAIPAATAEGITNLIADLIAKGLSAWSAASGIPITTESIQALLPNSVPLTAPTS